MADNELLEYITVKLYICIASITIETVLLYSNFIMYKALATDWCYTG